MEFLCDLLNREGDARIEGEKLKVNGPKSWSEPVFKVYKPFAVKFDVLSEEMVAAVVQGFHGAFSQVGYEGIFQLLFASEYPDFPHHKIKIGTNYLPKGTRSDNNAPRRKYQGEYGVSPRDGLMNPIYINNFRIQNECADVGLGFWANTLLAHTVEHELGHYMGFAHCVEHDKPGTESHGCTMEWFGDAKKGYELMKNGFQYCNRHIPVNLGAPTEAQIEANPGFKVIYDGIWAREPEIIQRLNEGKLAQIFIRSE